VAQVFAYQGEMDRAQFEAVFRIAEIVAPWKATSPAR
jgi:hypothetical protein